MRYCLLSLAAAVMLFAGSRTLAAHCQMPCGIYDDQMRVNLIEESCATIEKAMDEIRNNITSAQANGEVSLSVMQAMRWTTTKEEHAAQIQEIVADYFLTQRIKPDTQNYDKKLELLHGILISAMKCRQTLDPANVQGIRTRLDEFSKLYFVQEQGAAPKK